MWGNSLDQNTYNSTTIDRDSSAENDHSLLGNKMSNVAASLNSKDII